MDPDAISYSDPRFFFLHFPPPNRKIKKKKKKNLGSRGEVASFRSRGTAATDCNFERCTAGKPSYRI